jgi:hypothetical protein
MHLDVIILFIIPSKQLGIHQKSSASTLPETINCKIVLNLWDITTP